jgi:hypothetical protein
MYSEVVKKHKMLSAYKLTYFMVSKTIGREIGSRRHKRDFRYKIIKHKLNE